MKKTKVLLAMALIAIGTLFGGNNLYAQWTSKTNLITNPSFETDNATSTFENHQRVAISGWSILYATFPNPNDDWAQYGTVNAQSKQVDKNTLVGNDLTPSAPAGDKFLFLRTNWAKDVKFTVSQTISVNGNNLPKGYYRLSCKAYTFASEPSTFGLSIYEGNTTPTTVNYNTEDKSWKDWSVTVFKNDANTSLTIEATMTPGGQGSGNNYGMFLDDFQLEYLASVVEDGVYYLYNQYDDHGAGDQNRFLARGKDKGARAVVDKYGIPVRIINEGNDIVKLQFADGTNGYVKGTWWLDTDGALTDANTFKIIESTVAGKEGYHFATQQVSDNLNDKQYMYVWLKNANSGDYYAVAGNSSSDNNVEGDFSRTVWKLLTPAERNAIVNAYPTENMGNVIAKAISGNTYGDKLSSNLPASQLPYWLANNCDAIDKTSKIGTATFAGAEYNTETHKIGDWTYRGVTDGNPGFGSGLVELYQETGTFSQTISGLDPGIYKITLQAFERHGDSDNAKAVGPEYGNVGAAYMTANGEQVHIASWYEAYSGDNDPNWMPQAAAKFNDGYYVNEVYAYVSNGTLTINVTVPDSLGANWFIMNNFTLTYYSPTTKIVDTPEGTYYLRNKATGEYITFDGYWGTYYSMSDAGKQLRLETSADGFTLMHTTYLSNTNDKESSIDTKNYFYSFNDRPQHAFSDGNSTEGGEKWVFYNIGTAENPVYNIMNNMTCYYLSSEQGYDTNSNPGWGGLLKKTAVVDDLTVQWELVTKTQLTDALTASGATYPLNASFLIDEPDLITGHNNVYEEFYSWKVLGNDQTKYSDWNPSNITAFYYDGANGTSEGNCSYAYCLASDYPDILQTIENVPNGLYVVECQAAFRDGDSNYADQEATHDASNSSSSSRWNTDRLADGTYVNRAYLYANDNLGTEPTDAREIRDRRWIYENAQLMPVNIVTDPYFSENADLLTKFKNKEYTVQLPVYVTNGKLTIGVLQEIGINNNLLAFDRFRLTYYGTNYTGDEVKNIASNNLNRLAKYYEDTENHTAYQKNTITDKEIENLRTAISRIGTDWSNTNSTTIAKYNKVAQDYGETSISWYIYKVLQDDYDRGDYTTVAKNGDREDSPARYPFVDEASKKEVVKYFGAGTNTNNATNYYNNYGVQNYSADSKFGSSANMKVNGELSDLRAAISAIRTYVAANAEARYIEDDKVLSGDIADTEDARAESRMTRMALLTGSQEAITSEDGKYPAYETNPLMFTNAGVNITAPELNKIVKNARCWAPRDAYGHRFYDYTNYYFRGSGTETYEINIEGLMTGKYLVTISESHNNELQSVKFNAYVGNNQVVSNEELFRSDGSVWQTYTHSWQDISIIANIKDEFETVKLQFAGGNGVNTAGATMNICNLRIYRMDEVEMLLLDEDETILAKNGKLLDESNQTKGYRSVKTLLRRAMAKNQWNTLVLPVNLSKEQVINCFGEGTIIATMDGFAADDDYVGENPDNCIHFTTDDLSNYAETDDVILEGKVYLIKPTADPAVAAGETAKYKNKYEGQTTFEDVEGPIYYIDYVDYYVSDGEKNLDGTKVAHTDPTFDAPIAATGARAGKLSLQMRGSYGKTIVPVNATENGGTNYIYAFQQQGDNVYLVELNQEKNYTVDPDGIQGTGRMFKGFRGWVVANYKEGSEIHQRYTVLLDEGDAMTIIRGIDSSDDYSEITIGKHGIYDLQGRAIDSKLFNSSACPKGLYIVNGKMVLVK